MKYLSVEEGNHYNIWRYSNIHCSGSILGMKKQGYWNKDDLIVKCGSYYYNVPANIYNAAH